MLSINDLFVSLFTEVRSDVPKGGYALRKLQRTLHEIVQGVEGKDPTRYTGCNVG